MIPMTGLPVQSAESKPPWRSRERCPKARRSLTPSQRWLRSSSGRLRVVILGATRVLVDRKIGRVDHFFPFRRFVGNELAEVGRRARDRCAAKLLEFGEHRRILQCKVNLLVEEVDDFLWRSVRHSKAEKRAGFISGNGLANGRNIGQLLRTFGGRYRQSAQLARLDVPDRRRQI